MYADIITKPAEAHRFRTYRERVHAMTFPKQTKKEPAAAPSAPLNGVGPGADAGSKARLAKRAEARAAAKHPWSTPGQFTKRSNGNAA